jgi:hypothetical protein
MPIVQTVEREVRYCEDCKYFGRAYRTCSHPLTRAPNLVTRQACGAYCSVERGDYGAATTCGPQAKYFEQVTRIPAKAFKTSFWRRWFA